MLHQADASTSVFIKVFEVGVDGVKNLLKSDIIASLGEVKFCTELIGGLTSKRRINCQSALFEAIETAQTNRKSVVTQCNIKSSRTHAFYEFQLVNNNSTFAQVSSNFQLVD